MYVGRGWGVPGVQRSQARPSSTGGDVRSRGRRPWVLLLLAQGESVCSAKDRQETSVEEKGTFLAQLPLPPPGKRMLLNH